MVIDRDPMCSKMIRISDEVHDMLNGCKIIPQEPYDDCIKRILNEHRIFKKIYFTTQTRGRMDAEIRDFVLNPNIPDIPSGRHRDIWRETHPGEMLEQSDIIHHINGNHDDNRPENLMKVTAKEHRELHAKIDRERNVM